MKYHDVDFIEFFRYHPAMTEERRQLHIEINRAAYNLAKLVKDNFDKDDPDFWCFINQIQYIRMMLNQKVTIDEFIAEQNSDNLSS